MVGCLQVYLREPLPGAHFQQQLFNNQDRVGVWNSVPIHCCRIIKALSFVVVSLFRHYYLSPPRGLRLLYDTSFSKLFDLLSNKFLIFFTSESRRVTDRAGVLLQCYDRKRLQIYVFLPFGFPYR